MFQSLYSISLYASGLHGPPSSSVNVVAVTDSLLCKQYVVQPAAQNLVDTTTFLQPSVAPVSVCLMLKKPKYVQILF